jgi:hypothetical protein
MTLTLFALSREAPIPIQIIGSPSDGPAKPFALVERFFTSEFAVAGQQMIKINGDTVAVSTFPNGNGEARWQLADRSRGYLRSRGLDLAAVEAVVKGLSPRDHNSTIPGFDYRPGASDPLGLELLHEHLNTHVVVNSPTLECRVVASDYVYRISAVHGDPVYVYASVIDRPPPLEVAIREGTVIIINGVADPGAPTAADVVNADPDTWTELLAAPRQ